MITQNTTFDTQLNEMFRHNNWLGIIRLMQPHCQPGGDLWDDPAALSTYGFALTQQRQWQEAQRVYFRCIDLEPDRAVSYYNMGYVEYAQQHWEKAIYWFDEALKRYPEYFVVLYRKGYALFAWQKAAKARPVLEKALHIYESNTDEDWLRRNRKYYMKTQFTLGRVWLVLKEPQRAEQIFQWLLHHDQRYTIHRQFLFYELGKAYLHLKQYEAALHFLNAAAEMKPPKEYIWDQLGRVYHAMKQYQRALQCYQKALRYRKQAYIYANQAFTYWAMGNMPETIRQLNYALKQDLQRKMRHKIFLYLGRVHLQNNQFAEAEHYYRAAIEAKQQQYGVDYDWAYYELALCYARQGRQEEARKYLQTALTINPNLEWDKQLLSVLDDQNADLPPIVDVVMN